jgi:hypothetical protein
MKAEDQIKTRLLNMGFSEEKLLNNRGLIGAVVEETTELLKERMPRDEETLRDFAISQWITSF